MSGLSIVHVVATDAFAGVERYVVEVAPRQAAAGHRVRVLGGDRAIMPAALGPAVDHTPAPSMPRAVQALCRLGRVDIVHAHMTDADVAAVLSRTRTRATIVSTRHFAGPRGSRRVLRLPLRLLARGIDTEIAISRFVRDATGEDLRVIANGVAESPPAPVAGRDRVVLVIQRLEREKDTGTALAAFAASGLAAAGWTLIIAGRGAQAQELKRLGRSLGIDPWTRWLGFIDRPDELRARAAVHLATAVAEPFGLAVAESMAQGLPVIASSGGAHPELMGPQARLFPVGDTAAAAGLLRMLAEQFDSAHRGAAVYVDYGESLRQRQRERFSIGTHVECLAKLYAEVLHG